MTGILPIFKPAGITSNRVTMTVKRRLSEKTGHCGTLDPEATGVILILIGKATKLADFLLTDKAYRAGIKFGIKTDTGDVWGSTLNTNDTITDEKVFKKALNNFKGIITQIPPMYSAIKKDGVKLYELARKGIEIERESREIEIYNTHFISKIAENEFEFTVNCSKGTYIRTLCEDIAKSCGTIAAMSTLCRTNSCGVDISKCIELEKLIDMNDDEINSILISPEEYFSFYDKIYIPENAQIYLLNGGIIDTDRVTFNAEYKPQNAQQNVLVYNNTNEFLGIAQINNNTVKMEWLC